MASAPIGSTERIGELDALRGFALLGVFVVHFTGLPFYEMLLDEDQKALWSEQFAQSAALFVSNFLFQQKANSLFATLFGMGFWVMMSRLESRGEAFERIYVRRLFVLFVLGLVNAFFVFKGDVLHEYALAGLGLFLLRKMPPLGMLSLGLALSILGSPLTDLIGGVVADLYPVSSEVSEARLAEDPQTYGAWILESGRSFVLENWLQGGSLGWLLYVLGRFLLGAWIVRQGLLQGLSQKLPTIRRLIFWVMPLGLGLSLGSQLIYDGVLPGPGWLEAVFYALGPPIQAFGYGLLLILLFHSPGFGKVAQVFAPVGRTALTAYVVHGAIFLALFFPFTADLVGTLSPLASLCVAVSVFLVLTVWARFWLAIFSMGPLEYIWRWITYGARPRLLKARP